MGQPGVMLYFDLIDPLKLLSLEEKGRLFDAILEYGKYGVLPVFDGMLGMAWSFIQPKLDRDKENYERQVQQKQYASFVREIKKKGLPNVTYDEWKNLSDIERERLISADIERYPTTTTSATPTTKTNTSTTPTTTTAATTTATGSGGDFEKLRQEAIAKLAGGGRG